MKAEIEARIAALEAELAAKKQALSDEIAALEAKLASERAALTSWIENIPAELHNVTREAFDKIAAFFGYVPKPDDPSAQ